VILLHGYGADGEDLIALADMMSTALPGSAFVAPHAPERLAAAALGGRQWFSLTAIDPHELGRGAAAAAPALDRFIDAEMVRFGLSPRQVALVGFSQGAMMALHVGLRRAQPLATVVGLSGVVAGPASLAVDIRSRPPTLLIHGSNDEVVPVGALHLTREVLAAVAVPVEWHELPGLGHGIDERAAQLMTGHLRQHLDAA
jgi:phospholipase/carboxylesterase